MDLIISLGQTNTLAEYMILFGADNRPPMLDKDLYDSWKSRMELYMQNREHRRMILESIELSAAEKIQADYSGFAVPVFSTRDGLIACLNKEMVFLTVLASSRVTVQQVQGRQGQNYSSTTYKNNATSLRRNTTSGHARVVKCYNCQSKGHMARQCTQPNRPRNAAWYKEKAMLAEAQEARQILDEEQLAFIADPKIPVGQAQTIIPYGNEY
nr:hypothetical protein [Tanacetum cinerariifolium]